MTRIIADISVSLDGLVTGPDPRPDNGPGCGGALDTWALSAAATSSNSGKDVDVILMGGGATIGSALDAGLVDALTLHLAPIVLGVGTPLFTGGARRTPVQRSVSSTSTATRLTYDVSR